MGAASTTTQGLIYRYEMLLSHLRDHQRTAAIALDGRRRLALLSR